MKGILSFFVICLAVPSAFAASVWNPTGKYGYSIKLDYTEYSENHYHLQIKPWSTDNTHQQYAYSVSIDSVQGPTGHICTFQGDGVVKNGILEVMPDRKLKVWEDDELWMNCRIAITQNQDGSMNVSEDDKSSCSSLFLCGARANLGISDLKRNDSIDDIPFNLPSP